MINRLLEPTSGTVLIDGVDAATVDPVRLRRHIGYAIQSVGLFPHLTVRDNIATVPRLLGLGRGAHLDARRGAARARAARRRDVRRQVPAASCRAARRSASASPARWRPTRRCC